MERYQTLIFAKSENGLINSSLFLEWLKFFVASIPSTRPVLLIQDGHSSHISIEAIKYARTNNIHLLCLYPLTLPIYCNLLMLEFLNFSILTSLKHVLILLLKTQDR